jgi:hypothetical protein
MKINKTRMMVRKLVIEAIRKEGSMAGFHGDIPDQSEVAQAAAQLGKLLGGQPPTASAVRDALKGVFPDASETLWKAYTAAQQDLDLVYSDWDE